MLIMAGSRPRLAVVLAERLPSLGAFAYGPIAGANKGQFARREINSRNYLWTIYIW
jgi:hypothetical protein